MMYLSGNSLLDGVLQDQISGEVGWQQITYTYDPLGRRIAKLVSPPGGGDVDGEVTKYVYDGDQCIAEYDANDVQLRKYVYGPGIDEPHSASLRAGSFCMVEAAGGYAGTYYYHYDALGSVVALSDADGDTVQVYEYDVYGQVAASDPNHPNRFMFTGREFDKETGLYYYRARYYNPTIGRFLQTDPARIGANLYGYCHNNPTGFSDPSGLYAFPDRPDTYTFEFVFPITAAAPYCDSDGQAFTIAHIFFDVYEWQQWDKDFMEGFNWEVLDAHVHRGSQQIHVQFRWTGWSKRQEDMPEPPTPDLDWQWVMEPGTTWRFIETVTEPVITLNNVGLLTRWKLDRIVAKAKARVDGWWVRPAPFGRHTSVTWWEAKNLIFHCDTPFAVSSIDRWEWGRVIYHKSDINYYLEGYAMNHYNFRRLYAEMLVLEWKNVVKFPNGPVWPDDLQGVYLWFSTGWDDYGY